MPQFRNVGADPVFVSDLNTVVEPDALVEVPGELGDELDDAYVVDVGGVVRAWPKAQWADETTVKKSAKKSAEKE